MAYVVNRGKRTAWNGETEELYLRALDEIHARLVDKGRGGSRAVSSHRTGGNGWASTSAPEGELMKVSVSGGAAVTIAGMAEARGASWGSDESIVVNPGM